MSIKTPTRIVQNSSPNVLDLIMTNEEEMIDGINTLPALGLSVHICLRFKFKCYCSESHITKPQYNVHQADSIKMCQTQRSVEWEDVLTPLDTQSAYNEFSSRFTSVITNVFSLKHPERKKNLFMIQIALHLKNRKRKLWNKYHRST